MLDVCRSLAELRYTASDVVKHHEKHRASETEELDFRRNRRTEDRVFNQYEENSEREQSGNRDVGCGNSDGRPMRQNGARYYDREKNYRHTFLPRRENR